VNAASIIFRRERAGFTLLEVLVVLAMLGLFAGLFISGSTGMANDRRTAEDVFWEAVVEARKQALMAGREARMIYVAGTRDEPAALAIKIDGAETRKEFDEKDDVKLEFLSTQKARSTILVGGQLVETQTLPYVTFYGDGTCSPFRAQLRNKGVDPRVLAIDPWTCAQVLPSSEDKR
jgi:prepilin-type N-terminal cleavage/methylation domain-containing protein